MKAQIIKFETWLPLFPGFYNTIIDGDGDIDNFLHEYKNIEYDDLKIDWDKYHNDVSKTYCKLVNEKLINLGINCKINFQELVSPKFYNFATDSINVEIEFSKTGLKSLKRVINDNYEDLSASINQLYTSCSGFMSHYSNEIEDWKKDTSNWNDFSVNSHFLGSILDNLLKIYVDLTDFEMDICENIQRVDSYITNYNELDLQES